MPVDVQALPKKIEDSPHWRVNFRPSVHKVRIEIVDALDLIKATSVRLRGWPYPFLSDDRQEQILEQNYVASGSDWGGYAEYWRLYSSGQFINLFQIHEKSDYNWDERLRKEAEIYILPFRDESDPTIPGFISIFNLLYIFTEVFEFATRLCSKALYKDQLEISVQLLNVKDFTLIAEYPKFWHGYYPATSNKIVKSWAISTEHLLAESAEMAINGAVDFLKRFGWHNPTLDILKQDQEKFLSRRI